MAAAAGLELAGEGRGQPRNADLRRATSAAYYALFHAITRETVRLALSAASDDDLLRATRLVAHASVRDVCGYVSGNSPPPHVAGVVERLRQSATVSRMAADFMWLNEAREQADYDHLADFTKPRVLALIERAQDAVDVLSSPVRDDDLSSFLGLVALRVRS